MRAVVTGASGFLGRHIGAELLADGFQVVAGTRRDEASRLFLRLRGHAHELPVSRAYVHLFRAM